MSFWQGSYKAAQLEGAAMGLKPSTGAGERPRGCCSTSARDLAAPVALLPSHCSQREFAQLSPCMASDEASLCQEPCVAAVTSLQQFPPQSDALKPDCFLPCIPHLSMHSTFIHASRSSPAWGLLWGSLGSSPVPSLLCCWAGEGFPSMFWAASSTPYAPVLMPCALRSFNRTCMCLGGFIVLPWPLKPL